MRNDGAGGSAASPWIRWLGALLVLIGLGCLGWSVSFAFASDAPIAYADKPFAVAVTDAAVVRTGDAWRPLGDPLVHVQCPSGTTGAICVNLPDRAGDVSLWTQPAPGGPVSLASTVSLIPLLAIPAAAVGTLLVIAGIPWMMLRRVAGAWTYLLSEADGGWSLSKFQLLIWFSAVLAGYVALAAPGLAFPPNVPQQIWVLLGLAGGTSVASTLATPRPAAGGTQQAGAAQAEDVPLPGDAANQLLVFQQVLASFIEEGITIPQLKQSFAQVMEKLLNYVSQDVRSKWTLLMEGDGPLSTHIVDLSPAQVKNLAGRAEQLVSQVVLDVRSQLALTNSRASSSAAAPLPPPSGGLSDLVQNWNGDGDFSRYQYLLVSVAGAAIFLGSLCKEGVFPAIPPEFLSVVGSSQLTYLGVKYALRFTPSRST